MQGSHAEKISNMLGAPVDIKKVQIGKDEQYLPTYLGRYTLQDIYSGKRAERRPNMGDWHCAGAPAMPLRRKTCCQRRSL